MVAYWISSCHFLCLPCIGIQYAPFFHVTLQFFPLRDGLCSPLPLIKSLSMWPIWLTDCEKKWQCDSSQISPREASWVSTYPVVLISFSAEEHDALINCWSKEGEGSVKQTWTQVLEPGAQSLKSSLTKPRNPQPMTEG